MSDKDGVATVDELVTYVYENWPSAIRKYPVGLIEQWARTIRAKYKEHRGSTNGGHTQ